MEEISSAGVQAASSAILHATYNCRLCILQWRLFLFQFFRITLSVPNCYNDQISEFLKSFSLLPCDLFCIVWLIGVPAILVGHFGHHCLQKHEGLRTLYSIDITHPRDFNIISILSGLGKKKFHILIAVGELLLFGWKKDVWQSLLFIKHLTGSDGSMYLTWTQPPS